MRLVRSIDSMQNCRMQKRAQWNRHLIPARPRLSESRTVRMPNYAARICLRTVQAHHHVAQSEADCDNIRSILQLSRPVRALGIVSASLATLYSNPSPARQTELAQVARVVTIRTVSKYRQLSNASRTFDISSLVSSLSRRILTVLTQINFGRFFARANAGVNPLTEVNMGAKLSGHGSYVDPIGAMVPRAKNRR